MLGPNIETFIGCEADFESCDIVMFGAPYDSTTSFRPGARFASAAIRHESFGIETYSPYQDKDLLDYKIFDSGDIELPFGSDEILSFFTSLLFFVSTFLSINFFSSSELIMRPVFALSFMISFDKSLWQMFGLHDKVSNAVHSSTDNSIFKFSKSCKASFLINFAVCSNSYCIVSV